MPTNLQRLHALSLLHYPSLAALSAALGRHRHWAARRLSDTAGARVALTVAEQAEILTLLGEPASRLDAASGPILADGDADLLDYLGAHRRRSAALQRTTAGALDRLEFQGLIRAEADTMIVTAAGLKVLATMQAKP